MPDSRRARAGSGRSCRMSMNSARSTIWRASRKSPRPWQIRRRMETHPADGWRRLEDEMTETILEQVSRWLGEGRKVAIATVIETWGSAPQPVGSQLVIDSEGNFAGSVSGGCVEGAVVTEALEVIDSGKPRTLSFGVADETAWRVGLACGGKIRIFVEKAGD